MASNQKNIEKINVLGTGSFGTVVYPSLEDINNKETGRNRKKYITKLFFKEKNYEKLKTKKNEITKVMGEHKGSQFNTYKRKFKFVELNKHIRNRITNEYQPNSNNDIKENNEIIIPDDKNIYAIRMPYLGKSLDNIDKNDIININKCSTYNLLSECNKLFKITEKLAKEKYIHGDIESRNILLSIENNNLQLYIIDYDRFNSYDNYIKEYNKASENGFFLQYGPPESTILGISSKDMNKLEEKDKDKIRNKIKDWVHYRFFYWAHQPKENMERWYAYRPYEIIKDRSLFTEQITDIIFKFIDSGKEVELKYFDNFIMGLSLLDFFRKVKDIDIIECELSNDNKALCEFRDNILYPMISRNVENRIDPNEVVKRMNKILCKYYKNVHNCTNMNSKKEIDSNKVIKRKDKVSCVNNKGSCSIQGGKRRKTQKKHN